MTQEEILQGEKLIAEFIDLTPHNMFPDELQAPFGFEWMAVNINTRIIYTKEDNEFTCFEDYFKFSTSWDWLMPVAKKCVDVFNDIATPENWNDLKYLKMGLSLIFSNVTSFEIKPLFLAVVEFIELYNKYKTKP